MWNRGSKNYNVVRKDRICSGGGGILIYVKQHLNYRWILGSEEPNIEDIFIELQFSNRNILVGFIYRPPNNNLVNYSEWLIIMDNLLDKVNNTYNKVFYWEILILIFYQLLYRKRHG